MPKESNMEQVIERLRASKIRYLQNNDERAKSDGRAWVRHHAAYEDLLQIELLDFSGEPAFEGAFVSEFAAALGPDDPQQALDTFIYEIDPNNDLYIKQFVLGALELWAEVKPRL
jgi:hypothetical protein